MAQRTRTVAGTRLEGQSVAIGTMDIIASGLREAGYAVTLVPKGAQRVGAIACGNDGETVELTAFASRVAVRTARKRRLPIQRSFWPTRKEVAAAVGELIVSRLEELDYCTSTTCMSGDGVRVIASNETWILTVTIFATRTSDQTNRDRRNDDTDP